MDRILTTPSDGYRRDLHDWATLMPLLVPVLAQCRPRTVLDLGTGHYSGSTIASYMACRPAGYRALLLDNDPQWITRLGHLASKNVELGLVPEWKHENDWTCSIAKVDLVLIDTNPEIPDRKVLLDRWLPRAKWVLVHDAWAMDRYLPGLPEGTNWIQDQRFQFGGALFSSLPLDGLQF